MGNMGMAEIEAEEHREYMRQKDIEAGHKPGCLISVSPHLGGGYCNCGLFDRGISRHDPIFRDKIDMDDQSNAYMLTGMVIIISTILMVFLIGFMIGKLV